MTDWIKTSGKLVYEPTRHEFKKTHKMRTLIVELKRDQIDLYYQWFLRKKFGSWADHELRTQTVYNETQTARRQVTENVPGLARPMWGKHVTIVRGDEQGFKSPNWGKYEGQKIDIFYMPELERTWKFWSIPVKGDGLFEIRRELGLKAFHDFHITVGREVE